MPKGTPVFCRLRKEDGISTVDNDAFCFKVNLEATVELSPPLDEKENFNVWADSVLLLFTSGTTVGALLK